MAPMPVLEIPKAIAAETDVPACKSVLDIVSGNASYSVFQTTAVVSPPHLYLADYALCAIQSLSLYGSWNKHPMIAHIFWSPFKQPF